MPSLVGITQALHPTPWEEEEALRLMTLGEFSDLVLRLLMLDSGGTKPRTTETSIYGYFC